MTTLHTYFSYVDAEAALTWLAEAFGFETTMRWDDEHGVAHAELRVGDAAIIVFSDDGLGYDRMHPKANDAAGHGTYLAVADSAAVDAVWARALAVGAVPVWKPENTEWGNYRCRIRDLEGYEWSFGTHKPGEPSEDW
ncbi:VOC family protein [Actinophytocola algeriensis]|uniref:Putative glyoxalase superfamily protein PhnB n=1 Tax=Actinophytocola algeriensis TaxID=1768010 RepID=A0A7W7Q991_9PSEU|nr:VOC family protein [Actinophytocola algeriensis]MBB4909228.1 putative glyoxalase superfamily protein PhnB [Actinophytocola algeriensis]MBE1474384.1 putative glyoxalase superfamily protein PhnB [Actinophytocola algeriensis]